MVTVPMLLDEFLDRKAILKLKMTRITDPLKKSRAEKQFKTLCEAAKEFEDILRQDSTLQTLNQSLFSCHEQLWEIEDALRRIEAAGGPFDSQFVEYARSVYRLNDKRHALRQQIAAKRADESEVKSYID